MTSPQQVYLMILNSISVSNRSTNQLLAELPAGEWHLLKPSMQLVPLRARSVLHARHQTLEQLYFPLQGYISLMIEFADGFQAETGQVGSEGVVGVSVLHGTGTATAAAVVQTCGTALRLPAGTFARLLRQCPVLEGRLLRYAEAARAQAMQMVACNGHHKLEARLARCLLGIQDRHQADSLPVTHEMLATLLCAHRPSVSVAAKRLQQSGLVRHVTGGMLIADRPGLEQASCECYPVMRDVVAKAP